MTSYENVRPNFQKRQAHDKLYMLQCDSALRWVCGTNSYREEQKQELRQSKYESKESKNERLAKYCIGCALIGWKEAIISHEMSSLGECE